MCFSSNVLLRCYRNHQIFELSVKLQIKIHHCFKFCIKGTVGAWHQSAIVFKNFKLHSVHLMLCKQATQQACNKRGKQSADSILCHAYKSKQTYLCLGCLSLILIFDARSIRMPTLPVNCYTVSFGKVFQFDIYYCLVKIHS